MAVHARLGRRNTGKARDFDRGVAVAAIDAVARIVVLMAEGHGLGLGDVLVRGIGRALDFQSSRQQQRHNDHHSDDRKPRNCIRTTMEDLGHLFVKLSTLRVQVPTTQSGPRVGAGTALLATAGCDAYHPSE